MADPVDPVAAAREAAAGLRRWIDAINEPGRRMRELSEAMVREPEELRLPLPRQLDASEDEPDPEPAAKRQPRYRPPTQITFGDAERLQVLVDHRLGDPGNGALSQNAIATTCRCTRARVEKAIGLRKVGWDLLRSDPDFTAAPGFVQWPSPRKARRLLASERRRARRG